MINNEAIYLAKCLDCHVDDFANHLIILSYYIIVDGAKNKACYLMICYIACYIFNLIRVRFFDSFQWLFRSSCEHNLVGLAEQTLRNGSAKTFAGAGNDDDLGGHV